MGQGGLRGKRGALVEGEVQVGAILQLPSTDPQHLLDRNSLKAKKKEFKKDQYENDRFWSPGYGKLS